MLAFVTLQRKGKFFYSLGNHFLVIERQRVRPIQTQLTHKTAHNLLVKPINGRYIKMRIIVQQICQKLLSLLRRKFSLIFGILGLISHYFR